MQLELMIILNRFPELTLEEATNKLMTEKTSNTSERACEEQSRKGSTAHSRVILAA